MIEVSVADLDVYGVLKASMCEPQLQEGDEIVYINGRTAEKLSHEEVNEFFCLIQGRICFK